MVVWNPIGSDLLQGTTSAPLPKSSAGNISVFLLAALCSILLAGIIVLTDGNVYAATAFLGVVAVALVTFYRIDFGFFLFIGFVLAFDQYMIPGFEPITHKVAYFRNLKEISYIPSFAAAVVNPLELHLLFLCVVWFFVCGVRKEARFGRVYGWGAALLFFFGLAAFYAYGLRRGGEYLVALWEIRALVYLGVMFFLVPQIIQTKEQLKALMWVIIGAISLKAFQGIARFTWLGFSSRGLPTLTNHEDPFFIITLIILLFGFVIFNARNAQMWVLIALLLPLMMGFYVAQRRAAYAAILPSFVAFIATLSGKERFALFKGFLPVLLVVGLYAAIFWNSESRLASPLRLVKTGLSDDREEAGDRYYSNLYREFEKINLAKTVQEFPVFGVGFGNKYAMPIPLANIAFPLRDYIPHNQVLWVMVKTGVVGFFLFWLFFDSFAFRAASLGATLRDPYLKAVCAMAIAAVAGQITVSYFDMQLTYYRNMVYLGVLMGLMPSLGMIDGEKPKIDKRLQP